VLECAARLSAATTRRPDVIVLRSVLRAQLAAAGI